MSRVLKVLDEILYKYEGIPSQGFAEGNRVLSPTIQARQEFKGKKFISVPDPTYSDGRRRVMTPEYKKYVEELRAKASPAEQRTIKAYNTAKEKLGRIPSIEEVRAAAPGKSKPALSVVRKFLEKNNLELSKPRGGLKEAILKSHTDLTKELGRPPRVAEIDEQTKNLSKMKNPDGRKSVISEYLNEAKLKYSPALFKTDPKVRAEARAKAAATLRAKDKPRLGQPRKTPEDILQRERYKRMEDAKRDPKKIKRKISKELTETPLDVHHPFPKKEKETLRRLMALDQDANRAGVVREIEERRNKIIREQNILLKAPAKNRRRLEQINAEMKRLRAQLRKTPYGGFLGFPVSGSRGKIKYIGFDKAKSLAGLKEGEKLLDKDFAKATKKQAAKMIELGAESVEFAKPSAMKELMSRTSMGIDPTLLPKAAYQELVKPAAKFAGKAVNVGLGPTGLIGLNVGLGVDPTQAMDRIGIAGEAALAKPLVQGSLSVTDKIKTPLLRKIAERASLAGMSPAMALRAARIASPLGLASLGVEGLYHLGKAGYNQYKLMQDMSEDERREFLAQQYEDLGGVAGEGA